MNLANSSSMEEIPLEDIDRMSMEYRVIMAYAQRRLSASKYRQLLESEAKEREVSSQGKQDISLLAEKKMQGLSSKDQEHPFRKRSQKKKEKEKKKSKWKRLHFPSCLRVQTKEEPSQTFSERDTVNGCMLRPPAGVGSEPVEDDSSITLVADRLAEIVDNSRSAAGRGLKTFVHTVSIEEDGGEVSKSVFEENAKGNEEKIIETIVALIRKSGDELQKKMQKDKTFSQYVLDLMSYAFFRRVADQFLEEAPVCSTMDSEVQVQSTKVAFAMEVTARLTAIDKHPMNVVLGFGTRYLKENFSPWIYSQGGWEKALGIPDQEEIE